MLAGFIDGMELRDLKLVARQHVGADLCPLQGDPPRSGSEGSRSDHLRVASPTSGGSVWKENPPVPRRLQQFRVDSPTKQMTVSQLRKIKGVFLTTFNVFRFP